MSKTENPFQNNEISDTVAEFEKILTPEEEKVEETNEETVDDPVETEIEEEIESEDDIEEEIEGETEESEEDEIEAEDEEELELYDVKVNGEEIQVNLEELKSGYSRTQDYTQKTQKIAEIEKNLKTKEGQVDQQTIEMSEERALYKELLPKMRLALKNNLEAEPDWNKLIDENPQKYLKLQKEWDNKKDTLQHVENEIARVEAEERQKEAQNLQQMVDQGRQLIAEKIPEWQDEKIANSETKAMMEYAQSLGFSGNELSEIYDGRLVLLLRDAWSHSKTKKAIKSKPKSSPSRVAKAGSSNRIKSNTPRKKAMQKLRQSGKVSDASKVFEQLL